MLGQVAVAPPRSSEVNSAAPAMDGDDHVDVVDERCEVRRFGRRHPVRGMPVEVGRLAPAQLAAALGGCRGDHVGHLLERAAVVGHEPEAAAQRAVLVHARRGQQLGERAVAGGVDRGHDRASGRRCSV
jgi:hypothetical protein